MKQKLRRSRRSVFGKKRMPPALKTFLWVVVCVAVVAAGYFGAMWVSEGGLPTPDTQASHIDTPDVNSTPDAEDTPTPDAPQTPTNTPVSTDNIRGFYLPAFALKADNLATTFSAARAAGFNAVVFDVKDTEGNLYYQFANAQAKKVGYADGALSAADLTALIDLMKDHGLSPIPRLYAFNDNTAASVLADARIVPENNHSWAWYDGDPNNGGKKWLNPYSEAAHTYIGALAKELKEQGAYAVMLDGVQFPKQLSGAYLGEEAATVSKSDALTAFVAATRSLLGADYPLLLTCTAESALGTATQIYGGNPLTFGASMVSPLLSSNVQESVEKMLLRTQVLEEKPALAPVLKTIGLTAEQVSDAIAACLKGGAKDFILFDHEGYYEFSAYTLP